MYVYDVFIVLLNLLEMKLPIRKVGFKQFRKKFVKRNHLVVNGLFYAYPVFSIAFSILLNYDTLTLWSIHLSSYVLVIMVLVSFIGFIYLLKPKKYNRYHRIHIKLKDNSDYYYRYENIRTEKNLLYISSQSMDKKEKKRCFYYH